VYDLSGRMLEQLVNQTIHAGYHSVVWDASEYGSGIYFYKIVTGDFTQTKKMVFMK
jgi:hypothetical protein